MSTEILPTAEGDLGRTPFAHLLVYAVDQQLTGALFLHVPDGVMHSVRLECGRPVKVQMGDGFARLGNLMVEAGLIDKKTHDLPRVTPGLIGESLVVGGHINRETLNKMVERQFYVRMTHLFSLPAATRYAYFAGMNEIIDDGAPNLTVHPLALIWAGLREHATTSAKMRPVLERIGDAKLKLHAQAAVDRLLPTAPERLILEQLRQEPPTLRSLVSTNNPEEALIRRVIYGLVILRFLDFGTEALPLFPEKTPPATPSASTVALARIRLQQSPTRKFTAAAPDDVGDGDRIRPQPRTRKRSRGSNSSAVATITPNVQEPKIVEAEPSLDVKTTSEASRSSESSAATTIRSDQTMMMSPADAMYELARRKLADGDRKGALVACQQAREIDPDEPNYAVLATWIRAIIGGANLEACVQDLDKLLNKLPEHVPALFYRGYLRRRIGDEEGAVADLQRVLELDPAHEDAQRELKRIERRAPAKRPSGLFQA